MSMAGISIVAGDSMILVAGTMLCECKKLRSDGAVQGAVNSKPTSSNSELQTAQGNHESHCFHCHAECFDNDMAILANGKPECQSISLEILHESLIPYALTLMLNSRVLDALRYSRCRKDGRPQFSDTDNRRTPSTFPGEFISIAVWEGSKDSGSSRVVPLSRSISTLCDSNGRQTFRGR